MAEQVQAALDDMVEPLRDLLDRRIFTQDEVSAIVTRRRESEYLLRRRVARKADFLRYIQAELALERLRHLRTEKRRRQLREEAREQKRQQNDDTNYEDGAGSITFRGIGDGHVVKHINLLFVRMLRKFKSDLSLHLQHVEFCKQQKQWNRLGRVYAEALQLFPRQDGLWIEAASHEYFGPTKSIRTARILLQRGLRINGTTSQDLWVEYFVLELHHVQHMTGRRNILMGHSRESEEKDDPEPNENGQVENDQVENDQEDKNKDDDDDELHYKIPRIVYKNAIQSIPDSLSFRLRFLEECEQFPRTESLETYIESSIEQDFDSTPESWVARAMFVAKRSQGGTKENTSSVLQMAKEYKYEDNDHDGEDDDDTRPTKKSKRLFHDPVLCILFEGMEKIPTDEMYLHALRFVQSYQLQSHQHDDDSDDEDDDEEKENKAREKIQQFLEALFQKRDSVKEVEPKLDEQVRRSFAVELVLEHAKYYLLERKEDANQAIQVLKEFCTKRKGSNHDAAPWIHWVGLIFKQEQQESKTRNNNTAIKILQLAVSSIPMKDPNHMKVLLQLFGCYLDGHESNKTEDRSDDSSNTTTSSSSSRRSSSGSHDENETDETIRSLFQSILLLAPGLPLNFQVDKEFQDVVPFCIRTVPDACRKYLSYSMNTVGIAGARKVYMAVLFHSTVVGSTNGDSSNSSPPQLLNGYRLFVDDCIQLEEKYLLDILTNKTNKDQRNKQRKDQQGRIRRLYKNVIALFQDSPWEEHYRQEWQERQFRMS